MYDLHKIVNCIQMKLEALDQSEFKMESKSDFQLNLGSFSSYEQYQKLLKLFLECEIPRSIFDYQIKSLFQRKDSESAS